MGNLLNRMRSGQRVVAGLVMIGFLVAGVLSLLKGGLLYKNHWGGLVFAPIAIPLGLFGLYLVLFRWQGLEEKAAAARRLKGRAARKSRQAESYRAPIDDYDKPWRGGA